MRRGFVFYFEVENCHYSLEIGDYLEIKRDTVCKWISEKGMFAHKIVRLWKFKKDQVDAWVEAGGAEDRNKKGLDE